MKWNTHPHGGARFGVGIGVVVILSRWLSGDSISASPRMLVKYGIIGISGWALMVAFAFMLFGYLGKKVRKEYPVATSLADYLHFKLDALGYRVFLALIVLVSLNMLMLQTMAAGVLIQFLFGSPLLIGMGIALLLALIYSAITTSTSLHRFPSLQIVLLFGVAILIPLYFFVRNGAAGVYGGIYLYHPYLLVLSNTEALLFVIAGVFIGFGQVFADRATWQRLYLIEEKKVIPAFLLSSFVWFTLFLSFLSIVLIVIYPRGFQNSYSLLFDLLDRINQSFILALFIIAILTAIFAALSAEVFALISLRSTNRSKGRNQGWGFTLTLGTIAILLNELLTPSVYDLFFFFGALYAALLAPILVIITHKGTVSNLVPLAAVVGLFVGWWNWKTAEELQVIWLSAATSIVVVVLSLLQKKVKNFGLRRKERIE